MHFHTHDIFRRILDREAIVIAEQRILALHAGQYAWPWVPTEESLESFARGVKRQPLFLAFRNGMRGGPKPQEAHLEECWRLGARYSYVLQPLEAFETALARGELIEDSE